MGPKNKRTDSVDSSTSIESTMHPYSYFGTSVWPSDNNSSLLDKGKKESAKPPSKSRNRRPSSAPPQQTKRPLQKRPFSASSRKSRPLSDKRQSLEPERRASAPFQRTGPKTFQNENGYGGNKSRFPIRKAPQNGAPPVPPRKARFSQPYSRPALNHSTPRGQSPSSPRPPPRTNKFSHPSPRTALNRTPREQSPSPPPHPPPRHKPPPLPPARRPPPLPPRKSRVTGTQCWPGCWPGRKAPRPECRNTISPTPWPVVQKTVIVKNSPKDSASAQQLKSAQADLAEVRLQMWKESEAQALMDKMEKQYERQLHEYEAVQARCERDRARRKALLRYVLEKKKEKKRKEEEIRRWRCHRLQMSIEESERQAYKLQDSEQKRYMEQLKMCVKQEDKLLDSQMKTRDTAGMDAPLLEEIRRMFAPVARGPNELFEYYVLEPRKTPMELKNDAKEKVAAMVGLGNRHTINLDVAKKCKKQTSLRLALGPRRALGERLQYCNISSCPGAPACTAQVEPMG